VEKLLFFVILCCASDFFVNDNKKMGKSSLERFSKFYAVKVGLRPGVYRTWNECNAHVRGVKGAIYKSFNTEAEARAFVDDKKIEALKEKLRDAPKPRDKKARRIEEYRDKLAPYVESKATLVYTDGSSLNNGAQDHSARSAGIGVFFGENDPRNVSEKLMLLPLTNQRAELFAAIRGLEILIEENLTTPAVIITDSKYTINCLMYWINAWLRNNWISTQNTPVKNRDLVERLYETHLKCKALRPINFLHVPGHCGLPGNTEADQLAVQASSS
jgi:ribonuclease HI